MLRKSNKCFKTLYVLLLAHAYIRNIHRALEVYGTMEALVEKQQRKKLMDDEEKKRRKG